MIRSIIVDDEPLALDVLEALLSNMPNIELVARCENAFEANAVLQKEKIDLMFLDIQMPQLSGLEFLKSLSNPPAVIFTTAFPQYAVDGFELDAVDYLLKPISMERIMKAVNKVSEKLSHASPLSDEEIVSTDTFFFVKADKKLVKVNFDEILYIEGLKDYVIIRTEGTRVITLQTMKSLEEKLPDVKFQRIHRSFIVNMDKIIALDGNVVELMEKGQVKHLPIGKNYRDELMNSINNKKI
jgi:DNA-binding LytR/AlgR family response regulator